MSPEDDEERKRQSVWQQIGESIKNLFSIKIDVSSSQTIESSKQQMEVNAQTIQQATDLINTTTEAISAVAPLGSLVLAGSKTAAGAEVTAGEATFAALDLVTMGKGKATNNLVKIVAKESDVIVFSSKVGGELVEGISNFLVKDGKLYLNQLHLQGSSSGKVGRNALWEMAKDLGRQHNTQEVIIQGGKRTTGKYKGTVPSPITIKVK